MFFAATTRQTFVFRLPDLSGPQQENMERAFVSDIWSEIFQYLAITELGRVSLVEKSSPSLVWSLAPVIRVEAAVPRPYDLIFRHTGSNLRDLYLEQHEDYPTILRHLVLHCPRLEHLAILEDLLKDFTSVADRLASLLPRLSHFEICEGAIYKTDMELVNAALVSVFALQTSPLSLRKLTLQGDFELTKIIAQVPHLVDLHATITWFEAAEILPLAPQLENLTCPDLVYDGNDALEELLEAISPSKLAQTLSITFGSDSFLFFVATLWDLPVLLDNFNRAGIATKFSMKHVTNLLRVYGSTFTRFRQALVLICQGHPQLPTKEEIQRVASSLFEKIVPALEPDCTRFFVETFGFPVVNAFAIAASCLLLPFSFSEKRMQALLELGLLRREDLTSCDVNGCSLFASVRSDSAMQWLLENMNQDDAYRLLHAAPIPCLGARLIPRLEACASLVPSSFFSFPHPDDFREAAENCIDYDTPDALQILVDATGVQNISGDLLGTVLWNILCSTSPTVYLDIWLKVIETCPNSIRFDLKRASSGLEPHAVDLYDALSVLHVLNTMKYGIVSQANENVSSIPSFLHALAKWLIDTRGHTLQSLAAGPMPSTGGQWEVLHRFYAQSITFDNIKTVFDSIVDELCRPLTQICLAHGVSPRSDLIWKSLFRPISFKDLDDVFLFAGRLFDACAEFTNDIDLHSHRRFVEELVTNSLSILKRYIRLVEKWLPRIHVSALNDKYGSACNGMDMVLLKTHAPHFSDLSSLIEALVKKGCRISHSDRKSWFFAKLADPVAVELYFDATRVFVESGF